MFRKFFAGLVRPIVEDALREERSQVDIAPNLKERSIANREERLDPAHRTGRIPDEGQRAAIAAGAQPVSDKPDPRVADALAFTSRGAGTAPTVRSERPKATPKRTEPILVDPSDPAAMLAAMRK